MQRIATTVLFALFLSATLSGEAGPGPGEDPFARFLFPPDAIMGHAQEIGLDDAQRNGIRNEVRRAQTKFLDLQFDLQSESEKMVLLLQEKTVDEAKVLAQVDRILALEKEVKKTQIGLLVRIKNLLTPAQQARLSEIRKNDGK